MKNIAIVTCLKSNNVCAGCACLTAFNGRIRSFERYKDEELTLKAFMRCSHCFREVDPMEDPGFLEKCERLKQEGVEIVHIGVCCFKKDENGEIIPCEGMKKMADAIAAKGIDIVWGTHGA